LAKSAVDHCHFGYNKKIPTKTLPLMFISFFFFGLENIESSPKQKINGTHG
jgi:hypothetical protein